MMNARFQKRTLFLIALPGVRHAADLLDGQHELQDQRGDPVELQRSGRSTSPGTTTRPSSPIRPGTRATSTPDLRGHQHGDLAHGGAAGGLCLQRYSFLGDKHVFFWLLTNRMTPPAVFLLPFFQLYTTVGLMDTHIAVALAHLLFNVPLAVWILEGFMSGIPREIDETAYIDGYSFPRFFLTIFMPLIKAGVGVAAFFCFMFSWVELLMARTLTSVNAKPIVATMTRTVSASGMDWACWPRPAC
jgi:hypothetical protein